MTEKPDVICDARAHACHCGLASLHKGYHECANEFCGGAWSGNIDGNDFVVIRWPRERLILSEDK